MAFNFILGRLYLYRNIDQRRVVAFCVPRLNLYKFYLLRPLEEI